MADAPLLTTADSITKREDVVENATKIRCLIQNPGFLGR
jgi:hypothetical protein